MASPSWLVRQAGGLCVALVVLVPRPVLAQLPSCESVPLPQHFKTDNPDPINQGNDLTYTIAPVCTVEEMTTVDVPVELIHFGLD